MHGGPEKGEIEEIVQYFAASHSERKKRNSSRGQFSNRDFNFFRVNRKYAFAVRLGQSLARMRIS